MFNCVGAWVSLWGGLWREGAGVKKSTHHIPTQLNTQQHKHTHHICTRTRRYTHNGVMNKHHPHLPTHNPKKKSRMHTHAHSSTTSCQERANTHTYNHAHVMSREGIHTHSFRCIQNVRRKHTHTHKNNPTRYHQHNATATWHASERHGRVSTPTTCAFIPT